MLPLRHSFLILALSLAACRPVTPADEAYNPVIDPANFVSGVSHPLFNLTPGRAWSYSGKNEDGDDELVEVEVTDRQKTIMGIPMTVLRDQVWLNGEIHEDTLDWYAQDNDGNVWYFGEAVDNYDDGRLHDHDGSWEAGIDGALPGIVMKANPQVGDMYRQEYYVGEAEDMAEVLATNDSIETTNRVFENCLRTKDWNPLEPDIIENKVYCPGAGNLVYEEKAEGETGWLELQEIMLR